MRPRLPRLMMMTRLPRTLAEPLALLLLEREASALLPPWILAVMIWWIPPSKVQTVALLLNPLPWRLCPAFWVTKLPAPRAMVVVVVMLLHLERGRPLVLAFVDLRQVSTRCPRMRRRQAL